MKSAASLPLCLLLLAAALPARAQWLTWASPSPASIPSLAAWGNTLFAATPLGLYQSPDEGKTWRRAGLGGALVKVAAAESVLFAVGGPGGSEAFRSTDGMIWTSIQAKVGLAHPDAFVSHLGQVLAKSRDGFVRSSRDGGREWQPFSPSQAAHLLFLDSLLLSGSPDGLYQSAELGLAGAPVPGLPRRPATLLSAREGKVFASFAEGGLWVSGEGAGWRELRPDSGGIPLFNSLRGVEAGGGTWMVTGEPAGGSSGGIFRSLDSGRTWTAANQGLPGHAANGSRYYQAWEVRFLGGLFFAATDFGIFRSADSGASWTPCNAGIPASLRGGNAPVSLFVLGADLFMTARINPAGNPVFRSSDLGEAWQIAESSLNDVREILAAPGGHAYAHLPKGLLRTADGGKSWQAVPIPRLQGGPGLWSIEALAARGDVLLFSTGAELFHSRNRGETWFPDEAFDPRARIGGLALRGADSSVFSSADGGAHWQPGARLPGPIADLAVHAGRVFALAGNRLLASPDSGRSWTPDPSVPGPLALLAGGQILAGTAKGLLASPDGMAWTTQGGGLPSMPVHALLSDGYRVFAADSAGIHVGDGPGKAWTPLPNPPQAQALAFRLGVLFAATPEGIRLSVDGGKVWALSNTGLGSLQVRALCGGSAAWAATAAGLFRSDDLGKSWKAAGALPPVAALAENGGGLFAATDNGLYRSADGGFTWRPAGDAGGNFSALAGFGDKLYGNRNGLWLSSDSGATWEPVGGLPDTAISAMAMDRGRLMVSTREGGMVIQDGAPLALRRNAPGPDARALPPRLRMGSGWTRDWLGRRQKIVPERLPAFPLP